MLRNRYVRSFRFLQAIGAEERCAKGAQSLQKRTAGDLGADYRKIRRREKAQARRQRKEIARGKLSSLTLEDIHEANGPAKLKGPERKLQRMLEKSQQLEIRGHQLLAKSKKFAARYQSLLAQTKPETAAGKAFHRDTRKGGEELLGSDKAQSASTGGGSDVVSKDVIVVTPCQGQESNFVSDANCATLSQASDSDRSHAIIDQSGEKTGVGNGEINGKSRKKTKTRIASQEDAAGENVNTALAQSRNEEKMRILATSPTLTNHPSITSHTMSKSHRKRKVAAEGTDNEHQEATKAKRNEKKRAGRHVQREDDPSFAPQGRKGKAWAKSRGSWSGTARREGGQQERQER